MGVASVICLVLFFVLGFLFAPQNLEVWIEFYFEEHDGMYFMLSVIVVAVAIIPITKRMKLV